VPEESPHCANKVWCTRIELHPVDPECCAYHYESNDPDCRKCSYFLWLRGADQETERKKPEYDGKGAADD